MSDDEYDNFPEDFANISGVDWDAVLPAQPPLLVTQRSNGAGHGVPEQAPREETGDSDHYFDEDDDVLDSTFLAAVDALEYAATQPTRAGPSRGSPSNVRQRPSPLVNLHSQTAHRRHQVSNETLTRTSPTASCPPPKNKNNLLSSGLKRERSSSYGLSSPPVYKKGKAKEEEYSASAVKLVQQLEDEFQCPVCFDVLAASHIANPCGHSFCGPCGWHWIIETNKRTCPVCRTVVGRSNSMLPNVTLDSTIDKYIQLLGNAGIAEWRRGSGKSYNEWVSRKEAWKNEVAKRAKQTSAPASKIRALRQPPPPPPPHTIFDVDGDVDEFAEAVEFALSVIVNT